MAPAAVTATPVPPVTPDGRYIVVRGRLWRRANPDLPEDRRQALVSGLMAARRAVRDALRANDPAALKAARDAVDAAKVALGERGPVWWQGGSADLNRHLARNTPYADWFAGLDLGVAGSVSAAMVDPPGNEGGSPCAKSA